MPDIECETNLVEILDDFIDTKEADDLQDQYSYCEMLSDRESDSQNSSRVNDMMHL